MKEINADLKVLAKINFGGESYDLHEVKMSDILDINDKDDQKEALFDILAKSGLPKKVAKSFSPATIKQIEDVLIGDLSKEKK